jgi:hypothetical protein
VIRIQEIASRIRIRFLAVARNPSGSALPIFAVALPAIVGILGLSVDTGLWYDTKRVVQTSADAAAISGAFRLAAGDHNSINQAALADAVRNGFVSGSPSTSTVHNPPSSGPYAGNPGAVEVILTEQRSLLFSALYLKNSVTIAARAVAMVQTTGDACVLALDPSAAGAVTVQGSTTVNMTHCALAANSTNATAVNIAGNGNLTADTLWTAGGYAQGNSATLALAHPAETHTWPLADPFANETIPSLGSCTVNNASYSNVTRTISPGVYCNGLSFGSNSVITLNPGTYYIDRGNFSVAAQATVTCNCNAPGSGVTIVLTSSSNANQIGRVTINGGANVTLNAPSTAAVAYDGLLFFQDPRASAAQPNKFNGGATMNLTGGLYFPSEQVEWAGNNSSGTPTCTKIVAKTVVFTGNSYMDDSGCAAAGVNPIQITGVALVD